MRIVSESKVPRGKVNFLHAGACRQIAIHQRSLLKSGISHITWLYSREVVSEFIQPLKLHHDGTIRAQQKLCCYLGSEYDDRMLDLGPYKVGNSS